MEIIAFVMRRKVKFAAACCTAFILSGCMTTPRMQDRKTCGADGNTNWVTLRTAPQMASELRAAADAHPNFPAGLARYRRELWLSQGAGKLVLCRSDERPHNSCSGEWWRFERNSNGWQIAAQDAWICVT